MKQKSTTVKKQSVFAIALVAVLGLMAAPFTVHAEDYQAQIDSIDTQISAAEAEIDRLQHEANTLENRLRIIGAEKRAIQRKIDLNEAKRKKLLDEIKATEAKIKEQQVILGKTLGDLYVDQSITPIEMLASSKTIADYIDQQSYRSSIRDGLRSSIDEIKKLRAQLDGQKKQIEIVLTEQKGQRAELATKEQQQNNLLALTRGKEAEYQGLVSDLVKKREAAEAALAQSIRSGSYRIAPAGTVSPNQTIGAIGNSGLSSGPHLHLEVREYNDARLNPMPYIGDWQPPGPMTQGYGEDTAFYGPGGHPGLDYGNVEGSPIGAIGGGSMYRGCSDDLLGTYDNDYGYVAIVEHSSYISIYAHMTGGPAKCSHNTYW